jgi:hypothetical protein
MQPDTHTRCLPAALLAFSFTLLRFNSENLNILLCVRSHCGASCETSENEGDNGTDPS